MQGGERLQKVLAGAGVASRRASEELIVAGRVSVDGRVVTRLGTRVDPSSARIEVDGRRIAVSPDYEYILLNKPAGIVTSAKDPHGRTTVVDLVRSSVRLFPVGRLDADTQGLVLLTNHGELAHRLTHPRFQIQRVYIAEVRGSPASEVLERLLRGVRLEDGYARAVQARVIETGRARAQLEITMTEGRKHEVRRMLLAVGHPVTQLARTRYGPLGIRGLASGTSRRLTPAEIGELLKAVGL